MSQKNNWNLERLIVFHLEQNGILHLVKEFPYVMYSVRSINGTTRWSKGDFSDTLGYYIKYQTEYNKSNEYKDIFSKINQQSKVTLDQFYSHHINKINSRK
jgi:hypothetical protein